MYCEVLSGGIWGIDSFAVCVEVNVADGMPVFEMIGCLNREVKEARERVRTALRNSGTPLPAKRITVNLAPAEMRKEGAAFDLPVALGIMAALGRIPDRAFEGVMIAGELGLSGDVNGIRGVLPMVMKAKEMGVGRCLVPRQNAVEGAAVAGVQVIGVGSLMEAAEYLSGRLCLAPARGGAGAGSAGGDPVGNGGGDAEASGDVTWPEADFCDIIGQKSARRAAEVAASGFHNLLMVGPPGAGKTMLACRLPSILPPLTPQESLEVTRIYSVAGRMKEGESLITKRPFIHPHHTVTSRAMAGGGNVPKPGAVSLAHRGVLFLDELPEFQRETLEILRQPLEEGTVRIARSRGSCIYPASCLFVAAMNPCRCGYYPDRSRCRCAESEVQRYLQKISRPLLDRIDICIEVPAVKARELIRSGEGETGPGRGQESSDVIRRRVERTVEIQRERYKGTKIRFNSDLNVSQVKKYCVLGREERRWMELLLGTGEVSARAYHRILKVARTIADMEGSGRIKAVHLSEAVGYRVMEPGRPETGTA